MFRFLVAHLPQFRLERCGWLPEQPVVLLDEEKGALRVQAVSARAASAGVRQGMTSAEARALCPELDQELLDASAEEHDLAALTLQFYRLSPSIRSLPPDALVVEIERSAHLAGGERACLERIRIRLRQLGHRCKLAIADDITTALTCARWGKPETTIVPPGGGSQALAPLPVAALELLADEHRLLSGLGIHTIGDFARLSPAAVVGRLGPAGVNAHELARGLGRGEPIPAHIEDGVLGLRHDLPDPVCELEALTFVLGGLLRDVCAILSTRNEATGRVVLRFFLEEGGEQDLSMRLGTPSRSPQHITSLLRRRLERTQLASAIVSLEIEALELVPYSGRQRDLVDRDAADQALSQVVAHLQDALGSHAVCTPALADRYRPEAEWTPLPPLSGEARSIASRDPGHRRPDGSDPVHEWRGRPQHQRSPRPSILLDPPQAIEVRGRGTSQRVRLDGRWLGVRHAKGPEQLTGEWWTKSGFCRAYWRLHLEDGRAAWVYREDDCWALHGWWDG